MITLAWYILKVIICSGILCGYYYAALRNKIFHRWNRFYLLASIVLALVVPMMKINIFQKAGSDKGTVVRMLQTINNGDDIIIEYGRNRGLQFTSENILGAGYLLISLALLSIFFLALYRIFSLKKKYPETKINGINFISTDAKGTPFSFFNSIFWNNAIDLHSRQGHQIFNHEIAHVKEKHSYDKVFMNIVLLFFWINPFFWLIQKELGMIHEFIADKEALDDNDIDAFAEMVLQTIYPGQQFSITNNFFHSPLKRRLTMFTKNKNPKVSYASRVLVLPLAAIVFFAFTLRMKTINPSSHYYSGKKITVVIDAGHGGTDNGVIENDIKEKDINLSIAKAVKELNKNENLNIILSRSGDELFTPQDRVKFAESVKADLFISIHMDAELDESKNKHSGLIIFIPKNDNGYLKESKLLGSAIVESFKNNKYQLQVNDYLQQRELGIYVLKANQYPSVLIETGFITTRADLDYVMKPGNQQIIAENILGGIEKYAEQNVLNKSTGVSAIEDKAKPIAIIKADPAEKAIYVVDGKVVSKPEATAINAEDIKSIDVLKDENAIKKYGEKGRGGAVEIHKKTNDTPKMTFVTHSTDTQASPLYLLDGKEISSADANIINTDDISSVTVLKGDEAIKKYGDKAEYGVIDMTTKSARENHTDTLPSKLFTKVENEAEFPGGKEAWIKYIVSKLQKDQDKFNDQDYGTCLVRFIVNTDGSVSRVEATTMKDSHLAKLAIDAILKGPKWIPATQNDQVVASYRLQPVTLSMPK